MADNIVKLFENKELKAEICRNGIETGKCCSLDNSSLQFERILLKVNDRTAIE